MDVAGARKLAYRLHRDQLAAPGVPYLAHLEALVGLVVAAGGDARQQILAWLHGAADAGLGAADLRLLGCPRGVAHDVAVLSFVGECYDGSRVASEVGRRPRLVQLLPLDADERAWPGAGRDRGRSACTQFRWRVGHSRDVLRDAAPGWMDTSVGQDAGSPVPPDLADRLASDDPDTVFRALVALWRVPEPRRAELFREYLPRLLELEEHAAPGIRYWVVTALGMVPEGRAAALRAVRRRDPSAVNAALGALSPADVAAHRDDLLAVLPSPELEDRRAGMIGLLVAAAPEGLWPDLLDALGPQGYLADTQALALARRERDDRVRDRLRLALDGGTRLQSGAIIALGEWRDAEAVPALAALLRLGERGPYVHAIDALGKIGGVSAVAALASACDDPSVGVRHRAVRVLRRLSAGPQERLLALASADPDALVREEALRWVAACGDAAAVGVLLAQAEGRHARVALRGLARIADPGAVRGLGWVIRSVDDPRVRFEAARAAVASARGRYRPTDWGYEAGWDPPGAQGWAVLATRLWVFGRIGDPEAADRVLRHAAHHDLTVRRRAVEALGLLGSPLGSDAVLGAVADPAPKVRATAATALGRLVGATRDGAQPPDVRLVRAALERLAEDPRRSVREAAAAALTRVTAGR